MTQSNLQQLCPFRILTIAGKARACGKMPMVYMSVLLPTTDSFMRTGFCDTHASAARAMLKAGQALPLMATL